MSKSTMGWIALNCIKGIGPGISQALVKAFGSPEAVFAQPHQALVARRGIDQALAQKIREAEWEQVAARELAKSREQGINIITLAEESYPWWLKNISCPPPVLYVRGEVLAEDVQALAIVGSRDPSVYGCSAARALAQDIAMAGLTIVSGLARGIDSVAHKAALDSRGRTLAVMAHGLDSVYPPENEKLLDRIIKQGAVISEFPLGATPQPQHFPRRNRIISGLARGVLVIEARERSGALITARWAADQGREVFAVPGPYRSPLSRGTHALIQDGAKLVTRVEDVLAELSPAPGHKIKTEAHGRGEQAACPLTDEQNLIRKVLAGGSLHIDQLAAFCRTPVQTLLGYLLTLEVRGLVRSGPGQVYHWIGE